MSNQARHKKFLEEEQANAPKSRTKKKQEAEHIFQLGKKLVNLKKSQLKTLSLDDDLLELIFEVQAISSHIAKKRQLQRLGKILRRYDTEEIQQKFSDLSHGSHLIPSPYIKEEKWRDQLINNHPETLNQIIQTYPECDIQKLRQLIRNAQKSKRNYQISIEEDSGSEKIQPIKEKFQQNSRKLFLFLKELNE